MLNILSFMPRDAYAKRLLLSVVLLSLIAVVFWSQSRFPDLSNKALMGGSIQLEDPLSFEAKYPVNPGYPVWKRIGLTTINWIFTNMRGMTFGIVFGAAFLTMLRYLPKRGFKNGFANALLGLFVGAPLGVCVNCAAPIARGIFSGGARLETALAAMIASPTFNVIVLTMVLSLFPFYMVAIKLGLTLVVILLAIPLICRLLPASELQIADEEVTACLIDPANMGGFEESTPAALTGFVSDFFRDLWYIVRITVPMMLVAGFLGAAMATLLPVTLIEGIPFNIFTLTGIVFLGLFLPAPIAFDVILAAVLLASGAPIGFVMALLFTLGIFSVYSWIIVAGTISFRAAVMLAAVLAVLGVCSGYMAQAYQDWEVKRTLEQLSENISSSIIAPAGAATLERSMVQEVETDAGKLSISKIPFNPRSPAAETHFTRMEAWHIGVDRPNLFAIGDMTIPFMQAQGSISAADIDNDDDPDVIISDVHGGVRIFLNDGSGKFTQNGLDLPEVTALPVLLAAPVDINNDGWIDLVLTTFIEGEYLLLSDKGQFFAKNLTRLKNRPDRRHVISLAFGDVNRDGYLDAVFGNQSALPGKVHKGEYDRNRLIYNDKGSFTGEKFIDTPGLPGETLSIVLSDFDGDGDLDLIEGNDFREPDIFYLGDGKGGITQIRPADGIIPYSTTTTMSIKTADFNNDLNLDIYITQIAGRTRGLKDRVQMRSWAEYCPEMERKEDQDICAINVAIRPWYRPGFMDFSEKMADQCSELPSKMRGDCRAMIMRNIAFRTKNPDMCENIPSKQKNIRFLCGVLLEAKEFPSRRGFTKDGDIKIQISEEELANEIPQQFGGNVLLVNRGEGKFENQAKEANLEITGWSWDVKVFDADNDGYQDVHILNGDWILKKVTPTNIFMRNTGGLKFEDKTEEFGLTDYLIITGSAAADYDNDGDIDEISQGVNGPVIAYWNNSQTGNSIAFEFRDFAANRYGIGNKLIISYGENGAQKQLRELKLSGGYSAFDEAVMHFGLGEADTIDSFEIQWATGGTSVVKGPFEANARYRIERH